MILEKETHEKFGYWANKLSKYSHKLVICRCEGCKTIKLKSFRRSNLLCKACSNKKRSKNKKNYCKDCGIRIITLSAKRCSKCEGKNRWTVVNKYCINCGKKINKSSTGRCLKCAAIIRRKLKNLPHKCIECDNTVKSKIAKRCRLCANRLIAKNRINKPTHGKQVKVKNIYFHSSWEANFAKWCSGSAIKWKYEPRAFELSVNNKFTKYYPDFYLSEFGCYIEVKGYWRDDAKKKFKAFKKQYKNVNLKIFDEKILRLIGVIK